MLVIYINMKNIVSDLFKTFVVGVIFAVLLCTLVTIISIPFVDSLASALVIGKRVLLILGSTGLLIFSGLMLKRNGISSLNNKPSFENYFNKFNYAVILLFISTFILFVGCLVDYLIFALK